VGGSLRASIPYVRKVTLEVALGVINGYNHGGWDKIPTTYNWNCTPQVSDNHKLTVPD